MQGIRLYPSQQPVHCSHGGSGFRAMKDKGAMGLWNLQLRKTVDVRWYGKGVLTWSPLSTPKRTFLEPVEGKSELHWRFQDVGSSSVLEYLPRSESYRMMNLPDRVMYIIGSKAGRAETRSPWTCQTWNYMFEFSQLGFRLALVQYFLNISWFLIFGMVIHILCHCMFKVCNFFNSYSVPLYVSNV